MENLLLRHQLAVLTRPTGSRPQALLRLSDKLLWILARQFCAAWRQHLSFVTPDTVVRWHRQGWRLFWRWKSRSRGGRPKLSPEVRELIATVSRENRRWGTERIRSDLLKLATVVSNRSIRRYRWRAPRRSPSQTWRTFLRNHAHHLWAVNLLTLPTLTFKTLCVLVFIAHGRRELVNVNVTTNPMATWVWRQIIEATPWGQKPRHLLRNRDAYPRAKGQRHCGASDRDLAPRVSRPSYRPRRAASSDRADRVRAVLQPGAAASDALLMRVTVLQQFGSSWPCERRDCCTRPCSAHSIGSMRVRWRRLLALGGLVVVLGTRPSGAAANGSPGSAADNRERFFGAVQAIYNPDRAAQAGVQWERLIFPWSLIQKDGPRSWNDGYFTDQQIAQETARGIEVVGVALYTPQWATSTPDTARPTNVPANLYLPFDDPRNYWGQFMYKLAERYAGQINTWIVWNEPDLYSDSIAYTWDGTITDTYQLVRVASQAIERANPSAKVALPGLTYWSDREGNRPLYLARFMEAASKDPTAAATGDYFDIVILHQYGNPLNVYVAAQLTRRTLALYGLERPIWIGESNLVPDDDPMNPIGPTLHGTMDEQASYVIQAFALARAAGVERMSMYKMVDERHEGPDELYGLVRNDGSVRPAFHAYQTAMRYMSMPTSATYTWTGASDPPNHDQLTRLIQSNTNRTQWYRLLA